MSSTLRIEHPKGDVVKTIDLPEGTVIKVGGMHWHALPKIDRLEVVVPFDFAATEVSDDLHHDGDVRDAE